ncbi:ataxin-7-like protein 3 isoform X1 [Pangasianodon hypophthalmus]|uniref:ataxin-7-like protein 3 isoform X1 n=1 Tax=Pangasianodon hypophthalmus TaxID=310915 RepID=UPI002306FEDD|nr:ataxin-7-like protein 3 isoform X1 [Pangasianodon hypophthalmus]XP_034165992.2 ataxin-7-like protein 3 isoform X1 [Pangasianodon hypophthalmus]
MKMDDMSLSGLDNTKLEALAHDIYSDLVEDACLGLCFEVHRAVKQGYFFLDETDQESMKDFEIVDQPGLDIFGQVYNQWKNKECVCPNCSRSIAASRFAPHLEKCLGMGRNSSRIASRRIASSNNTSKSESDQEDNDDINDNDWSYGSEKKPKKRKSDKNPNSPRRSKSLKHKNGELSSSVNPDLYKYNYSSGISYETLGPEELRFLLTTQCGVVSEHTKKMCTRSQRCPQHTDEQRRAVRVFLLGPSASTLPDPESVLENDGYDTPDGQLIMSRLQWDGSSDISPSDSASSKASTNNSDSKRPKKKKKPSSLLMSSAGVCEREKAGERGERERGGGGSSSSVSGLGGAGTSSSNSQSALALSNRKKRPRPPPPPAPNIYDDLN